MSREAVCAWTTIPVWLPFTVNLDASVAVTDCVAAVLRTTALVNVWMPWSQPVVQFGVPAVDDVKV